MSGRSDRDLPDIQAAAYEAPARHTDEPHEPAAHQVHLLDYVRILYKRRLLAGSVLLAVVVCTVAYMFAVTPVFEASARLLIEADKQNVVAFKEVVDQNQATDSYYQTQYKLLESRTLAARTLDTLKLWDHPEFARESGDDSAAVDPLSAGVTPRQEQAVNALLERLIISPVKSSRLVDVRFRSTDPALAASLANAYARSYIEQDLEFKFLASKEASDWLGRQLADQRKKLEESEVAFQRYREANEAISLEQRENIVVQKLADVNTAVTRAKTERIEKEVLYEQVRGIESDRAALDTFPAILANTFIQQQKTQLSELQRQRAQLADRLGNRHPDMIKIATEIQAVETRIEAETAKAVESVRNEYLAAVARERSLVAALGAQRREALIMNQKSIEGNVLQRDVESNRQMYESLLQRAKETGVSGELRTSNIRLVELADVPRAPVSPKKLMLLLLAVFGGTALALGLTFFVEYLDDRLKNPEEIRTHLGLPTLGMIPKVAPGLLGTSGLIGNGVPLGFAEAFRTVRTSILFSVADADHRTVAITSTAPGEGKTLTASNIAAGLAQTGERVLLIDADMRRPRVHQVFEIDQEPGLSNLLVGDTRSKDAMHASSVPGLWVLPAGRIPPNPAELLGSSRFKDFLSSLNEHFEWVVIDLPPVLAVTDASVVGHLARGIVFVVGAELTSRRAAVEAVERLTQTNGRVLGVVLNRVNLERHSYYYSQHYRREYGEYYVRAANP